MGVLGGMIKGAVAGTVIATLVSAVPEMDYVTVDAGLKDYWFTRYEEALLFSNPEVQGYAALGGAAIGAVGGALFLRGSKKASLEDKVES